MHNDVDLSSEAREWSIHVSSADQGRRLDAYLSSQISDYSRNQLKQWIKEGLILVSGKQVKAGHPVRWGDRITVRVPQRTEGERIRPEPMDLHVLYEDDHLIVVNKAAGVVVHPGAGHDAGTLVHGLLARCGGLAMQGAPLRPGIVHRLDQYTSGALAVAKTERAYLDLIRQFKLHSVEKIYLAVVYGSFVTKTGEMKTLIGRHPEDRKKMTVLAKRGREAITRWQIEREWGEVTLLRLTIETGRTHQIRVHMNHVQHPIVGDATYGGGKRRAKGVRWKALRDLLVQVDRPMLHAWRLCIAHPITGLRLAFEAPLPQDFRDLLHELDRAQAHEHALSGED